MSTSGDIHRTIGDRWVIEHSLGSGGFGVVYAALDTRRNERVALKTLRRVDGEMLARFKREFRSLADLVHPNLVSLYELVSESDLWFFTMELIDGIDLLTYARRPELDSGRRSLRSAFAQLAAAVASLHAAGKLHCDLKPSNVLVERSGRVVVLDFGLVTHLGDSQTTVGQIVGTLPYMSPEHAAGRKLTEASDWYSFGVVLYEALTGRLPIEGDELLVDKQLRDPPAARALTEDVPLDLSDLCVRLLAREPDLRPSFAEIVFTLERTSAVSLDAHNRVTSAPLFTTFVGRGTELRILSDAFTASVAGRATTVYVEGVSGIGKSALVQRFAADLADRRDTLVFHGRCYEREAVPYKALDGVVDALGSYLRRIETAVAASLIPVGIDALARIFPVLESVDAVAVVSRLALRWPADPLELRSRAIGALETLLSRLAQNRTVVIIIDDLQWGDIDSAVVLAHLIKALKSRTVLIVLAYRSEDRTNSHCLQALPPGDEQIMTAALTALHPSDAAVLARTLLQQTPSENSIHTADIVRESRGSPLVIHELVQYQRTAGDSTVMTFEEALRSRIRQLPPPAQEVLRVVSLAGEPISELVALQSAGVEHQGRSAVAALRHARLVRAASGGPDRLVTFHDRIRETVVGDLDSQVRLHLFAQLASGLDASGEGLPETLARHYAAAGMLDRAAIHAATAARQAEAALAFDRAAELYQLALTLGETSTGVTTADLDHHALRIGLANSLANGGHGVAAADAYLAAAAGAYPAEQLMLQQRAAEHLMHSGHVDRGLELLRSVMAAVNLSFPEVQGRVPRGLLLRRMHVRLRGLRWRERSSVEVPAEELLRVDACSSVATGLALVDIARGAVLQSSNLVLALDAGEPYRVARALAMEAAYQSTGGVHAAHRATALIRRAREIGERIAHPHAIGLSLTMGAACAWNAGNWRPCLEQARQATAILRERCSGVTWERDTARIFEVDALRWLGRWREMKALVPELIADARARGDLYAETVLQMHCGSCAALADDRPTDARAGLSILGRWSTTGFHVEHLVNVHNQVEISLYEGDGETALARITEAWPLLTSSLLLRVQTLRIQMYSLRARAAVARAASSTRQVRDRLIRAAAGDAKRIMREKTTWGDGLAYLITGSIEVVYERPAAALVAFKTAAARARAADMHLHVQVANRCRALLGEPTSSLADADAMIASEEIRTPFRLARVMAPCLDGA